MATNFSPVSSGRVSGEIVEQVKAAIRDGRLAPGDQLPPERNLTKQLGVSRVSVRDALRMLEAHGLVEVRVGARGGAFVTAPAPKLVGEGIGDMLTLAAVSPADLTEARMVFELGILELACERATEDDLRELDEICDRADALFTADAYDPELSAEFHTQLARCSRSRFKGRWPARCAKRGASTLQPAAPARSSIARSSACCANATRPARARS
jgi:GntR family transcriptional repressor for pyruvate dehydrogenase complex